MEAVVGGDVADREDVLDVLSRLIDKSLVLVNAQTDRPPRCRLLEPLRQFGQERLRDGEAYAIQERHAAWFLAQFEQAWEALVKSGASPVRMYSELDNLLTALRWLIEQRDGDRAQRLAGAFPILWFGIGLPGRGASMVGGGAGALSSHRPAPAEPCMDWAC